MNNSLLEQLDEASRNPNIQKSLSKILPNSSDATDYNNWLKGSIKFSKDNEAVLKALMDN